MRIHYTGRTPPRMDTWKSIRGLRLHATHLGVLKPGELMASSTAHSTVLFFFCFLVFWTVKNGDLEVIGGCCEPMAFIALHVVLIGLRGEVIWK